MIVLLYLFGVSVGIGQIVTMPDGANFEVTGVLARGAGWIKLAAKQVSVHATDFSDASNSGLIPLG